MNIPSLKIFLEKLYETMNYNGDEALDYFKTEWPKFSDDERAILKHAMGGIAIQQLTDQSVNIEIALYWMALSVISEKEVIDGEILESDIFPKLILGEGMNGNQIVKIFKDLKEEGFIASSYELIAEAISIVFPIEYSTAYKDLTEVKRLVKVKNLFR